MMIELSQLLMKEDDLFIFFYFGHLYSISIANLIDLARLH